MSIKLLSQRELEIFDTVDEVIESATVSGNPQIVTEFANELIGSAQVRGLALAKLCHGVKARWSMFEAAGIEDTFEVFMEVSTGRKAQTINKYVKLWENLFANDRIPKDTKDLLMTRDMEELVRLTALAGETEDPEVLKRAALSKGLEEIREIVEQERGGATSSGMAIRLFFQQRPNGDVPQGTLFARKGDSPEKFIVGYLKVPENETEEKAINRILNSAHVTEIL